MNEQYMKLLEQTFSEFGVTNASKVLDVGCGNGDVVKILCDLGFDAHGIDVEFKKGDYVEELRENERIQLISIGDKTRETLSEGDSYNWPDFGVTFDIIISKAVIEHIQNLNDFVNSSSNYLSPQGIMFHYYPSKCSLIEPHTGVPIGALFTNKLWFWFMCSIGICFKSKRGKWRSTFDYMKKFTCFRWQTEIDRTFESFGFVKSDVTRNILSSRGSKIWSLLGQSSAIVALFGVLRSKAVVYRR